MSTQPFACSGCGRQIGKRRGHYILDGAPPRIVCIRCVLPERASAAAQLHARLFSGCTGGHELFSNIETDRVWDHRQLRGVCTRAGARWLLKAAPGR